MADRHGRRAEALDTWASAASDLSWTTHWSELHRESPPYDEWFVGGRLNLAANCLDRHLAEHANRPAILWEGEPGDRRELTYRQLNHDVVSLAGALRGLGIEAGDRVALHLGWLPETVAAMLACARLGAVFTVIPVSLPVEALALRLDDFQPRVLFTQDGGWRHGTILPLKARADEALSATGAVEHTVVVRRTGVDVSWFEGDRWLADLLAATRPGTSRPEPEPLDLPSDHPVLAAYIANRRGHPVAIIHGAANLLANASVMHRYGLSSGGVFWCPTDIGWMGTQAHGVFGPLVWGDTAVMYEGTLDVPRPDRAWQIIRQYEVTSVATSPSVVRTLRGWSQEADAADALSSLRRVTMVGEPVDRELVQWLRDDVGRGRIEVADGWGQIELGAVVSIDNPVDPDHLPDPGFEIVNDDGRAVADGEAGELVMRLPWAGTLRAVEGVAAGEMAQHWSRHASCYSTGDRARRTDEGLQFLGRIDEVVSVSGQLVSLTEVRDVLLEHPFVEAAEVVERVDRIVGISLVAAIVLGPEFAPGAKVAQDLQESVRDVLGGLSRPRALLFVDRFGDELPTPARRRVLSLLAASVGDEPATVTWDQILSTAPPAADDEPVE